MMNILFLTPFPIIPYAGGVQRVTDILTEGFVRKGYGVTYLCYDSNGNVVHGSVSFRQRFIELSGKNDKIINDELCKICGENEITHVIVQVCDKYTNRIVSLMPLYLRNRVIYSCHIIPFSSDSITRRRIWDTDAKNLRQLLFKVVSLVFPFVYKAFFNTIEKDALREGFRLATKFCFISEKYYDNVLRHMPDAPLQKFIAINNPNTYGVQYLLPDAKHRENSVLWVGRVANAQKNAYGFIRMWQIFSKSHPQWTAYFVGEGEDLPFIKKYVARNNIQNISFEGKQQDVMTYYKRCKYLCVTSFGESWGMIITEAMSCGCVPIVMDTFPTLTDIVDDGKNGIICNASPKDMAGRMNSVIDDSDLWRSMSANAVNKVKEFDVERILPKWECLLDSLK